MTSKEYMEKSLENDRDDNGYKELAESFLGNTLNDDYRKLRLIHMALGLGGEAGEVIDVVKKNFMYGKQLDIENVKEECGDILWYMSNLLHEIGSSFEEVMQMNVDKLAKRYPNGFTEKAALERKDKKYKSENDLENKQQKAVKLLKNALDFYHTFYGDTDNGNYLKRKINQTLKILKKDKNEE